MNVDQKETEVKKREILVSPPLFEAQSKQTSAAQGHCDRASVRGWSEMFTKKIEAGKHVIYTVRITAEQSHFSSFNRTQNRRESNSLCWQKCFGTAWRLWKEHRRKKNVTLVKVLFWINSNFI